MCSRNLVTNGRPLLDHHGRSGVVDDGDFDSRWQSKRNVVVVCRREVVGWPLPPLAEEFLPCSRHGWEETEVGVRCRWELSRVSWWRLTENRRSGPVQRLVSTRWISYRPASLLPDFVDVLSPIRPPLLFKHPWVPNHFYTRKLSVHEDKHPYLLNLPTF